MRPIVTTVTAAAANANGYATTQSLGAVGPLTLNGSLVTAGVGVPASPCRVTITSAGNDTGITWTIVGTSNAALGSIPLTEVLLGKNGVVVTSTQDFAKVASITASGATASTVTAGTSATTSSNWVPWDVNQTDFLLSMAGVVNSEAATWQVEYTYDPIYTMLGTGAAPFPTAFVYGVLSGKTTNADGAFTLPVTATRLTLTALGSVTLTQVQQGSGR